MPSKECYHFTELYRLESIGRTGLKPMLDKNSKVVGDRKPKISFSDTREGAVGLFANFFEVYDDYKNLRRFPRPDKPGEEEMYKDVMKSDSFEDYLGDGVYLLFDGTNIKNEGGNHGKEGGIYDESTSRNIKPEKLKVGMVRNNDTGEVSYSKYDYINYLIATMSKDDINKLIPSMKERLAKYVEARRNEVLKFRKGNYSREEMSLGDFVKDYEQDIQNSLNKKLKEQQLENSKSKEKQTEEHTVDDDAR